MPVPSEFPSVPEATEPFDERMLARLWQHSIDHPDRYAFVSAENAWSPVTFREAWIRCGSVAAFLHARGFERGDVACVVLANSWHYPIFVTGVAAAGGATSGASALFTDYELERQFADSRCSVVLTDGAHLSKVLVAAKKCPNIRVLRLSTERTSQIIISVHGIESKEIDLPWGVTPWEQVMRVPPDPSISRSFKRDIKKDLFILPYSRHQDREMLKKLDPNWEWTKESILLFLPFYHIYGFGLLMSVMLNGATGVVFSKFEPTNFCRAIEAHKVRFLYLVPPILVFLAKHPLAAKFDMSSLLGVLTGAAPAGKDLCEEFLARHKNVKFLMQAYGMTECGMVSHMPVVDGNPRYGSAGKLISNFDQKTGKEVALGQRGEILLRGASVMLGYLNRSDATKESIDEDGFLHTGDIGYQSEDGHVYIVDRLKELIKVKGLQVPPAELEDLLLSHPRIQDAAVIDRDHGELPRAYVVRADHDLSADVVKEFVASKVSHYKQLEGGVEFISEIPKSAAGKILRRFLRDKAKKDLPQAKI